MLHKFAILMTVQFSFGLLLAALNITGLLLIAGDIVTVVKLVLLSTVLTTLIPNVVSAYILNMGNK